MSEITRMSPCEVRSEIRLPSSSRRLPQLLLGPLRKPGPSGRCLFRPLPTAPISPPPIGLPRCTRPIWPLPCHAPPCPLPTVRPGQPGPPQVLSTQRGPPRAWCMCQQRRATNTVPSGSFAHQPRATFRRLPPSRIHIPNIHPNSARRMPTDWLSFLSADRTRPALCHLSLESSLVRPFPSLAILMLFPSPPAVCTSVAVGFPPLDPRNYPSIPPSGIPFLLCSPACISALGSSNPYVLYLSRVPSARMHAAVHRRAPTSDLLARPMSQNRPPLSGG
ncbi:hypothetical protein OBBRIDRAFT_251998 [Obba rivulosa]|uniref:Uncharacterized protein n=1 Tax=Obba rivulosa TaxID=1052685 RepID=A0A8E2J3F8_9APHY|nr:hypothetical protein OBBRIDRAFT_251998 [Obba rivulosa]